MVKIVHTSGGRSALAVAAEASARMKAVLPVKGQFGTRSNATPNSESHSPKGVTEAGMAVSKAARQVSVGTSSTFTAK